MRVHRHQDRQNRLEKKDLRGKNAKFDKKAKICTTLKSYCADIHVDITLIFWIHNCITINNIVTENQRNRFMRNDCAKITMCTFFAKSNLATLWKHCGKRKQRWSHPEHFDTKIVKIGTLELEISCFQFLSDARKSWKWGEMEQVMVLWSGFISTVCDLG